MSFSLSFRIYFVAKTVIKNPLIIKNGKMLYFRKIFNKYKFFQSSEKAVTLFADNSLEGDNETGDIFLNELIKKPGSNINTATKINAEITTGN